MNEAMMKSNVASTPPVPHLADMLGELEAQQESIYRIISGIEARFDRTPEPACQDTLKDGGYRLRLATMIEKNAEILRTLERITCGM